MYRRLLPVTSTLDATFLRVMPSVRKTLYIVQRHTLQFYKTSEEVLIEVLVCVIDALIHSFLFWSHLFLDLRGTVSAGASPGSHRQREDDTLDESLAHRRAT